MIKCPKLTIVVLVSLLGLFNGFLMGQCCTGYNFSREITLSNPNPSPLSNFQVEFSLNTAALVAASKIRQDGNDIYFVDSLCNPLNFWIEDNSLNTSRTNFWIKVPQIPASGSISIFMVYGNPSVLVPNSFRNGDNTFEFFDDFNIGTVPDANKWNLVNNNGSEVHSLTPAGYYTFTASDSANKETGLAHPMLAGNYEIGMRMNISTVGTGDHDPWFGWFVNPISRATSEGSWVMDDEGPSEYVISQAGTFPYSNNPGRGFWSFVRLRTLGNQTQARRFSFFPIAFDSSSSTISFDTLNVRNLFIGSGAYGGVRANYDFVFVRKAVSNEPSLILGVESPFSLVCAAPVPTLSQWSLIILALLFLCFGGIQIWKAKGIQFANS